MTSSSKWQSGVLVLVFCLSVAGLVWPSSATAEETAVSLPVEKVADYLYAMIEADREVYTKHLVERMQVKGVVVASENWEEKNTLPLPAQFLIESGRIMSRKGLGIQYRLISLWPINKRNVGSSEFEKNRPRDCPYSSDETVYGFCEGRRSPLLPGRLSGSCCGPGLHRLP
jgi:Protein of unknown function (DUF3365)